VLRAQGTGHRAQGSEKKTKLRVKGAVRSAQGEGQRAKRAVRMAQVRGKGYAVCGKIGFGRPASGTNQGEEKSVKKW